MSSIYPDYKVGDKKTLYYAEFDRGIQSNTFTIFKREFFGEPREIFPGFTLTNEVHPYQLFDGTCNEGCYPDPSFVRFMVDALNEKVERESK